jgi:hypothetical protein
MFIFLNTLKETNKFTLCGLSAVSEEHPDTSEVKWTEVN